MRLIFFLVAGYLLGSIPFGYLIARLAGGVDIRDVGSGNIGATNVYRNLGWPAGLLTVVGDVGKGAAVVLVARAAGVGAFGVALVGLAAIVGHCFPLFLHFRGGKGVATTVAVLLAVEPASFALFMGVWVILLVVQGRVSLASLGAAAALPLVTMVNPAPRPGMLLFSWAAAVIIFVRHHDNIRRLLEGSEKRLVNLPGQKPG